MLLQPQSEGGSASPTAASEVTINEDAERGGSELSEERLAELTAMYEQRVQERRRAKLKHVEPGPIEEEDESTHGDRTGRTPSSPTKAVLSPRAQERRTRAEAVALTRAKPSPSQQETRDKRQKLMCRSTWGGKMAPHDRTDEWSDRHKTTYSNNRLNPNMRSYFDRWLDARTPDVSERSGGLQPTWRLEFSAPSEEEREASKKALAAWSSTAGREIEGSGNDYTLPPRRRGPPERPWEHPPEPLPEDEPLRRPGPGGGGGGGGGGACASQSSFFSQATTTNDTDGFFKAASAGTTISKEEGSWDSRHSVLWCNEQTVGDFSRLNPMQFRSYFDRWRDPDVGARSRAARLRPPEGQSETVSRVVPVWRLEPVPGRTTMPDEEELQAREPVLKAKSGTGANPDMLESMKGRLVKSSSMPAGRLPNCSPAARRREDRWNGRHQLLFHNEKVSRLDRSYFDRWIDPECLHYKKAEEGKTDASKEHGSVLVWSLGPSEGPDEVVAKVQAKSNARFSDDGHWNGRHQLMFYNGIHPNARSDFSHWRERPSEAAPKHLLEMADVSQSTNPSYRDPTAAMERRQREKLLEEEKFVKTALNEFIRPGDRDLHQRSLRQPIQGKTPKETETLSRKRNGWDGRHGVGRGVLSTTS
mmetsp:Transcript_10567/g.23062  ORF Transcript_10567/g.23062 Transcript_10567/m.23062 type:complete len:645 (-) Transcript_10567:29-1963(-)